MSNRPIFDPLLSNIRSDDSDNSPNDIIKYDVYLDKIRLVDKNSGIYYDYVLNMIRQDSLNPPDIDDVPADEHRWYGISIDNTTKSITRIAGNAYAMKLHKFLPVHELNSRRCLLLPDGTVNYYLNPNNSLLKADGSAAVLDGSDGNVMVEKGDYWLQLFPDVAVTLIKVSDISQVGFTYVPKYYDSAFEMAVNYDTQTAGSVINTGEYWRGGNGSTNIWDGTWRSMIGKPSSGLAKTQQRIRARNIGVGWEIHTGKSYRLKSYLFLIEFTTWNSQTTFTDVKTAEGYKTGGLGMGVTTMVNLTPIESNPIVPCGLTVSLGNKTGEVIMEIPTELQVNGNPATIKVNSYRGVEIPFGHLCKNVDGVAYWKTDGVTYALFTDNPAVFSDGESALTDYTFVDVDAFDLDGIVNTFLTFEGKLLMIPESVDAMGVTQDYALVAANEDVNPTIIRVGGDAQGNENAGLFCSNAWEQAFYETDVDIAVGTRLTYYPQS